MKAWLLAALVRLGADDPERFEEAISYSVHHTTHALPNDELAALLVSIAWFESALTSSPPRTDDGHTCTPWQVRLGPRICALAESDLALGAMAAIAKIEESRRLCRALAEPLRLSVYASGSCARGQAHSRHRWRLAQQINALSRN